MGGEREDVIQAKSSKSPGPAGEPETIGAIRFHESTGEVHFHDDAAGLKVAVPVAEWWKAWRLIRQGQTSEWTWHDVARKTILRIVCMIDDDAEPPILDCELHIEAVAHGDGFTRLERFTPK